MRSLQLFFAFLLVLIPVKAISQISVSNDITENTTWSAADSPVTVTETITVQSGAVLTIEPGVTVQMGSGVSLLVQGGLVASGTESEKITFTSVAGSPSPGDWGSVDFLNSADAGSVIDHVSVEYGAGADRGGMFFFATGVFTINITNSSFSNSAQNGINIGFTEPVISNSNFSDNAGYGIFAANSPSYTVTNSTIRNNTVGGIRVVTNTATIENNIIEDNGLGIRLSSSASPTIINNQIVNNVVGISVDNVSGNMPQIRDNTISGNSEFGIENEGVNVLDARFNFWGSSFGPTVVSNPSGDGDRITDNVSYIPWRSGDADFPVIEVDSNITENTTWQQGNVYLVTSDMTVSGGVTLTVEPGTIVKFGLGRSMTVTGQLLANGTEENKIFFTSERDDSAGGDSNQDGDNTVPARNDWGRININGAGSQISHAIIRYGGSTSNTGVLYATVPVALNDIIVSTNFRHGIYSREADQSGWVNVRSIDNTEGGIFIFRASLQITGGETSLNGNEGLYIDSASDPRPIVIDDFLSADNNSHGIRINSTGGSRFGSFISSMQNSEVRNNNGIGVLLDFSDAGTQSFTGNLIEGNSNHGIRLNHGMEPDEVVFEGNTLLNNNASGILSAGATFLNNNFEGNRFGISAWEQLGHIYTNESGIDENTFTNNDYPNTIGLYSNNLRGVLSTVVPEVFEHPTYVLATIGQANTSSHELVIEAGVTIKTARELIGTTNNRLRFDGKLTALGTEEEPIVFTSLYDHDFGGDVSRVDDSSEASSGDWTGVWLNREDTQESILSHVYFRYGVTNLSVGDLSSFTTSANAIVYENPFTDIWVDQADGSGFFAREAAFEVIRLRATNNGNHGINIEDRNSGNGFTARAIVRNSEFFDNGSSGIFASDAGDGAAYTLITNSQIENNTIGVQMDGASLPINLIGNTIANNSDHGIRVNSQLTNEGVVFAGNSVLNNQRSGILSTEAQFIDNIFTGNKFAIGAWRSLGHIYTDSDGNDGNQFDSNTYPGAIGLYPVSLNGTLSSVVPEAFEHPVYILPSIGQANTSSHELVIEAGVTIKTARELIGTTNNRLRFDGKLTALGTEEEPIVFTSLYDHDFGGDVSRVDDNSEASSGDWTGVWLNREGTQESMLSHVYFRYGVTNLSVGDLSSFTTSANAIVYENPFTDIWVDQADGSGFFAREAAFEVIRLRATNNGNHGINIEDRNSGNGFTARAIVRNSEFFDNGSSGIFASDAGDGATYTLINNSIISGNNHGLQMQESSLPISIQFNTIENNSSHGIFVRTTSEADTSLTVAGNTITGHTNGVGALISRAEVNNNTFDNNEFPVGFWGELSNDGVLNENGTRFEGNTIGEHTYQDAIALYSTNNISLNGKMGFEWPESFENKVFIPITGTTFINASNRVEVAPGTVFKLGRNSSNDSFLVRGELRLVGELEERIVVTSILDDSFGGDTNRDGNATLPSRSDWRYFEFRGQSANESRISNAIIRYGNRNLFFDNSSIIVESSFISNGERGVYSNNNATPSITNSDIHSNNGGIQIWSSSGAPVIQNNNIYSNDSFGLNARINVTAVNNYWGAANGPEVESNPGADGTNDGDGDRITLTGTGTEVTYRPFLTDRTGVLLGDVSEDGSISAFDSSLILQYLVELISLEPTQLAAADVSGDGSISALDASLILQYVVGIISGFPGAGKLPEFNPEDLFELETILADNYYEIQIRSAGQLRLMGAELHVNYPAEFVDQVEFLSTPSTSDWSHLTNTADGVARIAMAGTRTIDNPDDIIHVRFHAGENGLPDIGLFEISQLILNEVDLTEAANAEHSDRSAAYYIPSVFSLEQNFPNPFNPSTNIVYNLPVGGEVSVRVFNSIGQEVATLLNRAVQQAGTYNIEWNALSVSSGVYFYRIEVRGNNGQVFRDVKRMTLIK